MPPVVTDVVEPPRCIATINLPGPGVPSICAMQCVNMPQDGQQSSGAGTPTNCTQGGGATVCVMIATAEGLLYEYHMQDLKSPKGPTCTLEGESYLLAQKR